MVITNKDATVSKNIDSSRLVPYFVTRAAIERGEFTRADLSAWQRVEAWRTASGIRADFAGEYAELDKFITQADLPF